MQLATDKEPLNRDTMDLGLKYWNKTKIELSSMVWPRYHTTLTYVHILMVSGSIHALFLGVPKFWLLFSLI